MRRPANDAWFEKQKCGPFFVFFSVIYFNGHDDIIVEWCLCPDDEDKAEERALYGSDRNIRGPKDQLDALIDRAMREARDAAVYLGEAILTWARSTEALT